MVLVVVVELVVVELLLLVHLIKELLLELLMVEGALRLVLGLLLTRMTGLQAVRVEIFLSNVLTFFSSLDFSFFKVLF